MPTYAYRCSACGHEFDAVQRFADAPLTECPECHGAVRRVFQPVGVVFKGSGWYINDSRSTSSNGAAAKSEKSEKSESKSGKAADATTSTAAASTTDTASGTAKAAAD